MLEDHNLPIVDQNHGPLFHRWLPDGEKHAIVLNTGDPDTNLKVWFERCGFVDSGGHIRFDYKRQEVDTKIIPMQAILDAGPLIGILEIRGLSSEELAPIQEKQVGDSKYITLGKKIVKKWVVPPVARFLDILRTNYGQYWIRKLEKWDSRKESLGSYCSSKLQLKWSLNGGRTWERFEPDKREVRLTVTVRRNFREYLTEEDWHELSKVVEEEYDPSLAAFTLARTHLLLDQENLKHAFVEGVSALELALEEFIHQKLHGANSLHDSMSAFWNLSLPTRVITVATILGKPPLQIIERATKAIDIRNRIVHEGYDPPDTSKQQLRDLLETVSTLLSGPQFRFPSANPGNALMSIEQWAREQA